MITHRDYREAQQALNRAAARKGNGYTIARRGIVLWTREPGGYRWQ
jgi:hypothetical protein